MKWVFRGTSYQLNGAENETTIAFLYPKCQSSFILAFHLAKPYHVKLKKFNCILGTQ